MKCDLCDQPATWHITDTDGEARTERSLCAAHAAATGFSVPAATDSARAAAGKLRQLIELIRRNQRMPTGEELARLGGAGAFVPVDPGSAAFQEQRNYLERTVAFVEAHERFPTEEEVGPDPFMT